MNAYRNSRNITVKFAGKCRCCGGMIARGSIATYYPHLKAIAHIGGLDGNGVQCYAELKRKQADPGFVDLDRAYEDQCADICGR